MNEYTRATTWLYATLTAPAIAGIAERVHEHPAPQGAAFPLITYDLVAPDDVAEVSDERIWAEFLFRVTAIVEGESTKAAEAYADAIDARLHGAEFGTTADAMVIASVRERPFQQAVTEEGKPYRRLGGEYRLLVQPLNP